MLFFAVARGNQIGVCTNTAELNRLILGYPGAVYRVFSTQREADTFLDQALELDGSDNKRNEIRRVPTRGRTVVYLAYDYTRGTNYYGILVKLRNVEPTYHYGVHQMSVTSSLRALSEIEAVLSILDNIQDNEFTIYSGCQRFVSLYNKYVCGWKAADWNVDNKPVEFEGIKNLVQKIGNRKVLVKDMQNEDPYRSQVNGRLKAYIMDSKESADK